MESLATKYRPHRFEEVVGQDTIKTILLNQLKANDTKQAYLFTGGAGTGKTTTARIFAKELNGEIIEIDAASNNGVDNVRELRETSKFKPINHPRKVYIIDEVHMLSTGAFNALLKTLEEPPSHCVFILCTTDPQKIPATILSRVQRFDFRRMSQAQIMERLSFITVTEKCGIDYDAVEYIAKMSQGGMRDAISLLDTCLSYQSKLTKKDVQDILGASSSEDFFNLIMAMATQNAKAVLEILDEQHMKGKDLKVFLKGLLEFSVEIQKAKILGTTDELLNDVCSQIAYPGKLFQALNEIYNRVKYETSPKTLIEGELLCLIP